MYRGGRSKSLRRFFTKTTPPVLRMQGAKFQNIGNFFEG